MKKPANKAGGKGPPPSNTDDDWLHTASTIEPLKRRKARVHPATERIVVAPAQSQSPNQPKLARPAPLEPAASGKPSVNPSKAPPPLNEFDRRSVRKIRSGRFEIEARVDLHGMRQDEAHAALRTFLTRAHEHGLRYVLVITGKGGARSEADDPWRGRGVLKRNVPRWLAEPDLSRIVVSYSEAALKHGGEGALYIHIRARGKT